MVRVIPKPIPEAREFIQTISWLSEENTEVLLSVCDEAAKLGSNEGTKVSNVRLYDDATASYDVNPGDVAGYIMEVNLETGKRRSKGFGEGCFWTEWR